MGKLNCWEFMRCGRQPGGERVEEFGVCPAAQSALDGVNGGKNGGRCCWAVAGTYCHGEIQGAFAKKSQECISCKFFWVVAEEEGEDFVMTVSLVNNQSGSHAGLPRMPS